jgi:hypothetical protein
VQNAQTAANDIQTCQAQYILESALKANIWPSSELKLSFFDRYLNVTENPNINQAVCLELLKMFVTNLDPGPSWLL